MRKKRLNGTCKKFPCRWITQSQLDKKEARTKVGEVQGKYVRINSYRKGLIIGNGNWQVRGWAKLGDDDIME